jgi:ribonucleotide reductase beta subunit family protein with ferritin-like domain
MSEVHNLKNADTSMAKSVLDHLIEMSNKDGLSIKSVQDIMDVESLIDLHAKQEVELDVDINKDITIDGGYQNTFDDFKSNESDKSDDSNDASLIEIDIETLSAMQDESRTDVEIIKDCANSKIYSKLLKDFDIAEDRRLDSEEDLLDPSNDRLVLKPINPKFKVIWELYKKQAEAFWTPEKIDFSRDRHDFIKLDDRVQEFIKMILAFFAGADYIVNVNIQEQFSKIKVREANVAYGFQEMMENIHSEVYSDMLDNIIIDGDEKHKLINAFKTVESIKDMIGWGQAWIDSGRRIGYSLMAFTIFEGLMFSGAFAAVYWLKNQLGDDKMQGLIGSNEFIARDEGMHTNFGCLMYDFVIHRLSKEDATTMMSEAVEIAKNFNKDAIKVRLLGMNDELMSQYIEYVADRLMVYLGYEKIYGTELPPAFSFMEQIGILNKNNFFERRTSEYQMAHNKDNTADWKFRIIDKY